MKVAQLMATIPDAAAARIRRGTAEAAERRAADGLGLRQAAHDGGAWRRLAGEVRRASSTSRPPPPRSARCIARARPTASALACKLQYPDMQSAVEADLQQLDWLFAIHRRMDPVIDTTRDRQGDRARACARSSTTSARRSTSRSISAMLAERRSRARADGVAGALDRPAAHARLARGHASCSATRTRRSSSATASAQAMFTAWWLPFSRYGVIHGDPHLGNYTVFDEGGAPARHQPARLRLHPHLPAELRRRRGRSLSRPAATTTTTCVVHAYETWGFKGLSRELIDILNIWARFIYGPLLDDRVRTIADGVKPSEYGRREAFRVHQALKEKGPVTRAARVRVHGPRRDRARRRVPASRRAS